MSERPLPLTPNVTHGRISTYRVYGCRCPKCTEKQREVMADYYDRYPYARERQREAMRRLRAGRGYVAPESALDRELRESREAARR